MRKSRFFPTGASSPFSLLITFALGASLASLTGCGKSGNELASVSGKVTYRGKPLPFGSVMFLPNSGPPATGTIQSDGTFTMITRGLGEGAPVGKNRVRVVCFESQNPGANPAGGEMPLGKSLIPQKYNSWETSGIEVEVCSGANEPVVLELID